MRLRLWLVAFLSLIVSISLSSEEITIQASTMHLSKSIELYTGDSQKINSCSEINEQYTLKDHWVRNQKSFLKTDSTIKEIWISFQITNDLDQELIFFLPFFTGKYSEIILCTDINGEWTESLSGESIPSESKIIDSNYPDFQIFIPPKSTHRFYLKLFSDYSINTQITIYPLNTFLNLSNLQNTLGIIIFLFYSSSLFSIVLRFYNNFQISYVFIFLFCLSLMLFSLSEINFYSLSNVFHHTRSFVSNYSYFFVIILFHQAYTILVFSNEDYPSRMTLILKIFFALTVIIFANFVFDFIPIDTRITICTFASLLYCFYIYLCIGFIKEDYPPADLFFYSLVILLLPGFLYILYTFQIIPSGFPSYLLILVLAIHFAIIAYPLLKKVEVVRNAMEPSRHNDIKSLALSPKPLYKKSHILGINIENKILELKKLMELEKVFLDEDLHSGDLAAMLALTPHQLSQLLSQVLDTHYHKMIQEYRIQEAIQRIKLNEDKNLLTIGFEVGFQSKSAFNTAFKKITGKTPMELKKSLLSENQPN